MEANTKSDSFLYQSNDPALDHPNPCRCAHHRKITTIFFSFLFLTSPLRSSYFIENEGEKLVERRGI